MNRPQIEISVNEKGQVQLRANVTDQVLIYGMIEMAKDAVRQNAAKAAEGSNIVAAPATALNKLTAAGV